MCDVFLMVHALQGQALWNWQKVDAAIAKIYRLMLNTRGQDCRGFLMQVLYRNGFARSFCRFGSNIEVLIEVMFCRLRLRVASFIMCIKSSGCIKYIPLFWNWNNMLGTESRLKLLNSVCVSKVCWILQGRITDFWNHLWGDVWYVIWLWIVSILIGSVLLRISLSVTVEISCSHSVIQPAVCNTQEFPKKDT